MKIITNRWKIISFIETRGFWTIVKNTWIIKENTIKISDYQNFIQHTSKGALCSFGLPYNGCHLSKYYTI